MTQPAQAQITGGAPVHGRPIEELLTEELEGLREEVEELVKRGMSDEDAQGLFDWAAELEGKVRAVAAVLASPTPDTVAKYLRYVAAGIATSRSRRFATSSLCLLQAALERSARV